MNAIEVESLNYAYKNRDGYAATILENLNLSVREGELVAIQGPSGSGKSTLLYLLGLLTEPTKGTIRILGQDVSHFNDDERAQFRNKKISFIFQQFHLLPRATVLENILLPTQYEINQSSKTENIKKAEKFARLVGLENHLQHHPNQLSGGQQQRVAICRALMCGAEIVLADEPTGSLDSVSAEQILKLLINLNREHKKTIVIITHDNEVAKCCDRIIKFKDGKVLNDENSFSSTNPIHSLELKTPNNTSKFIKIYNTARESLPLALKNLGRSKIRTALTMLGIAVGISAVFSMITLGQFAKEKILAGYADLGVNTVVFYGYPNWDQKAIDISPAPYRFFRWEDELLPLKKIFPEIHKISPILSGWNGSVNFGGRVIDQDVRVIGIGDEALNIWNRKLLIGRNFSLLEIDQKSGVCIIGNEIAQRLFSDSQPLGQVVSVSQNSNSFGCRIIGVLKKSISNKEFIKPNLQIYVPFKYFQAIIGDWWSSEIKEVLIQLSMNSDVERFGKKIKSFFEQKYSPSGKFTVDSDNVLIAQMRKFLSIFNILLSTIAFVTLLVGGMGITNMMLVSVSERFREIGLRKAMGATSLQIRTQFLVESMIVCVISGIMGLILGFACYQLAIFAATKLVSKLHYEWILSLNALFLSLCSIVMVGILSGIFPALKAEKLQVIDALRSE